MAEIFTKQVSGMRLSSLDIQKGEVEAVVTSYGNSDKVNDVIKRGALDGFMKEFNGQLPMLFQHDNKEFVGEWSKFYEKGDLVIGVGQIYPEVSKGADAMALISRGMIASTSIGFTAQDYSANSKGGLDFSAIKLVEVSLVHNPANPKAEIQSVKSEEGKIDMKQLELLLRDAGLSRNESKRLIHGGIQELRDAVMEAQKEEDRLSTLRKLLEV